MRGEARAAFDRSRRESARESAQLALVLGGAVPTSPPVRGSEQRVLEIGGTIEARYQAWRRTEEGSAVFQAVLHLALAEARTGTTRIGVKALAEQVRARQKVRINNSHVSRLSRELAETVPELSELIELRGLKST